MVTNHSVMIGPNSLPMRALPCGCRPNNAIRTTTDSGSHIGRERRDAAS